MKLLSLGLNGTVDDIRVKLQQDCNGFLQDGFSMAIDQINKGSYTFLGCNIVEGELSFRNYERIKNSLRNYVARLLADHIIKQEEKRLVKKIIERNYYYFSPDERDSIYDTAVKILGSSSQTLPEFDETTRRQRIADDIQEYLDSHHELVVEGFIKFRLKDYCDKLTEVVDKSVDDLMLELEYKEFVRVLRYFVDVQEPQMEEVHVVVNTTGSFRILDSLGKFVNNQYLENFMVDGTNEINYEDLLISALITIAPSNIILHCTNPAKSQSVMDTIKNVFDGRIVVCPGCEICNADSLGHFHPQ